MSFTTLDYSFLPLAEDKPYLMVMKGGQIVDVPLTPGETGATGFFTPIVGVENGLVLDYDRNNERIFWLEASAKDSENVCMI